MKCYYCGNKLIWQSDQDNENGSITGLYIYSEYETEYEITTK